MIDFDVNKNACYSEQIYNYYKDIVALNEFHVIPINLFSNITGKTTVSFPSVCFSSTNPNVESVELWRKKWTPMKVVLLLSQSYIIKEYKLTGNYLNATSYCYDYASCINPRCFISNEMGWKDSLFKIYGDEFYIRSDENEMVKEAKEKNKQRVIDAYLERAPLYNFVNEIEVMQHLNGKRSKC